MFFFEPQNMLASQNLCSSRLPHKFSQAQWGLDYTLLDSKWIYEDLEQFLYPETFRRKSFSSIDSIGYFAQRIEFYLSLLISAAFYKAELIRELIKKSIEELKMLVQKRVHTLFTEQRRINEKIKSLFVPLDLIPATLHPNKIAA